jgi:2-C-methyl-D-erythritol 4-phosphate cytidylyltransferase
LARTVGVPAPTWAVVLAAGEGSRFGGAKQFARAAGRRLVDLAVAAAADACDNVILVLPEGRPWDGANVHAVVGGGHDRRTSVHHGLEAIPATDGMVIVHQAANPLATADLMRVLLETLSDGAWAAAPGLRPADLVRRIEDDGTMGEVVGRDDLVLVQTPAAFRLRTLREAHASGAVALEDTALVSAIGREVQVVPGDPRNVHVATPEDLELVAALLTDADR